MKTKILALCGICGSVASAFADSPLWPIVATNFFSATVAETNGGSWATAPTIDGKKFTISQSAQFDLSNTTQTGNTNVAVEALLNIEYPMDEQSTLSDTLGALMIYSADESNTTNWMGLVEGEWQTLTGPTAECGEWILRIEINTTNSPAQIRYLVRKETDTKFTALTYNENEWVATGSSATNCSSVAFAGSGSLTYVEGGDVAAESSAPISGYGKGDEPVKIDNQFISTYVSGAESKTAAEVQEALKETRDTGNKMPLIQCYALGLNPTNETSKPVPTIVTDGDGAIKIVMSNVTYKAGCGIPVKFNVKSSSTPTGAQTDVASSEENATSVSVPLETSGDKVKFYHVEITFGSN